ncbi:hypothetical protein [Pseudomonas umsongensis]|uniref:hypothetical protein n=1 Tax=Pseudomonas umsongensis TaxID=198618 RepID=UPI001CDC0BF6|nr:hypothetical protein [Pseudomonas umsongensis]
MALIDGHFVCVPKFDVEATLQAIEREKVSNLYLVPTLYHMLIEHRPSPASESPVWRKSALPVRR